jgi:hypothetical protein
MKLDYYFGKTMMDTAANLATAAAAAAATPKKYYCSVCGIRFEGKTGLKNHNEKTCRLLHLTRTQKNKWNDECCDITPTVRELYNAVKILTDKVITLETELQELRRGGVGGGGNASIAKMNILRDYIPKQTYIDWLNDLNVKRSHLEVVFEDDLLAGVLRLLADENNIPIYMFSKCTKIYVYDWSDNGACWSPNMTKEEFHKFVDILCGRFLREFMKWKEEYSDVIEQNQFWEDKYLTYSKKILLASSMYQRIYNGVKQYIQNRGGGGGGGCGAL